MLPGHTGVIAAMPEEASALIDAMHERAIVEHYGRRDFFCVEHDRAKITLVVSRVGKVSAAATAAELIIRFGVDRVIVTGVAGGLGEGVAVGDVVVATSLLHHDLDATPIWPPRVVPLLEVERFHADDDLSGRLYESASRYTAAHGRRTHRGAVVTGDQFITDAASAARIRGEIPDAAAVEMEGAAVAQVCFEQGVPCAVVRVISDRADDDAAADYGRSLEAFAAEYARGIVGPLLGAGAG